MLLVGTAGRGSKLRQRHLHHIALCRLRLLNVHESTRARGIRSSRSRSLHGHRVRRAARLTKVRQHDPSRARIRRLEGAVAMLVKAEWGRRRSGRGMRLGLELLELALLVLLVRGVAELVSNVAPREGVLLCKVADHGDLYRLLNRA